MGIDQRNLVLLVLPIYCKDVTEFSKSILLWTFRLIIIRHFKIFDAIVVNFLPSRNKKQACTSLQLRLGTNKQALAAFYMRFAFIKLSVCDRQMLGGVLTTMMLAINMLFY